jgi:signal recognition particle GTPase
LKKRKKGLKKKRKKKKKKKEKKRKKRKKKGRKKRRKKRKKKEKKKKKIYSEFSKELTSSKKFLANHIRHEGGFIRQDTFTQFLGEICLNQLFSSTGSATADRLVLRFLAPYAGSHQRSLFKYPKVIKKNS